MSGEDMGGNNKRQACESLQFLLGEGWRVEIGPDRWLRNVAIVSVLATHQDGRFIQENGTADSIAFLI